MTVSLNNTGVSSAAQSLAVAQNALSVSQQKLTTGRKIDSARDDGAAFVISKHIQDKIAQETVLRQNRLRASSILDVAQAAASDISDLLVQMKEKALALTDTSIDTASRTALINDVAAMTARIDMTAKNSAFDGINLLKSNAASYSVANGQTSYARNISGSFTFNNGDSPGVLLTYFSFQNATSTSRTTTYGDGGSEITNTVLGGFGNSGYEAEHTYSASNNSLTVNYSAQTTGTGTDGARFEGAVFIPQNETTRIKTNADGSGLGLAHQDMTSNGLGIDALSSLSPQAALAAIDGALRRASGYSAYYGDKQTAIDGLITQGQKMSDIYEAGYGDLVDADLSKEAANWHARQTQVALATQSLNIASQSSRLVLGLFVSGKGQ